MRSTVIVAAIVSSFAFACSQSTDGSSATEQSADLTGAEKAPASAANAPTAAAATAPGSAATAPAKKTATLNINQLEYDPTSYAVRGGALFTGALATANKSVAAGSSCRATPNANPNSASAASRSFDAGKITVQTPTVSTALSFSDIYNEYGFDLDVTQHKAFLVGGQTITFHGEGSATVPVFDASLVAPTPVTLSAPVIPETGNLTYKNGSDLDVAWTGGVAGDILNVVFLGNKGVLVCGFDAAAGSVTIPFEGVLDQVIGAGATDGVFSPSVIRRTTVVAGDYAVDVSLTQALTGTYLNVK